MAQGVGLEAVVVSRSETIHLFRITSKHNTWHEEKEDAEAAEPTKVYAVYYAILTYKFIYRSGKDKFCQPYISETYIKEGKEIGYSYFKDAEIGTLCSGMLPEKVCNTVFDKWNGELIRS